MSPTADLFVILLVLVFFTAAILAPGYVFLIRRRVVRYMGQRVRPLSVAVPVVERQGGAPLHLANEAAPRRPLSDAGRTLFDRMRNVRRSAAAMYLLAGLAAASVLAAGEYDAKDKWTLPMVVYIWPAVLTVCTIAVPSLRKRALVLGVTGLTLYETVGTDHFIDFVIIPTIPLLLVANRALRTIAPVLVLIGTVVAGAIAAGDAVGGCGTFFAVLVSGLLALALVPWAYERKYFSELSFQLAFVWSVFAVTYVMTHSTPHNTPHFWRYGADSLVLYACLTWLMLPRPRRAAPSRQGSQCPSCRR